VGGGGGGWGVGGGTKNPTRATEVRMLCAAPRCPWRPEWGESEHRDHKADLGGTRRSFGPPAAKHLIRLTEPKLAVNSHTAGWADAI